MKLSEFATLTGEWLRSTGPENDVVVSSRIRLARNLSAYPFLGTATPSDRTSIYRDVANAVSATQHASHDHIVDVSDTSSITALDREMLKERQLISSHHARAEGKRGVAFSREETHAVMINEEDHLRIQGFRSGLSLEGLWEEVSTLDDELARQLEFAYDPQWGYLTACPTNVGTGIRVSVLLHLPALKLAQQFDKFLRGARDMKLAVRGLYGEGSDSHGDLFQLSNQTTLGKSESEIIASFAGDITGLIIKGEREARDILAHTRSMYLDDMIWRAWGTLCNARMLTSEETLNLLSPVRMGIHMGRFREVDLATVNELFLLCQRAHIQKLVGKDMSDGERKIARATYIRQRLTGK